MDRVQAAGWQIKQQGDGPEVLVVLPHELDLDALAVSIRSALAAHGVRPPHVKVRAVGAIPRTALGKAPLVTRAA